MNEIFTKPFDLGDQADEKSKMTEKAKKGHKIIEDLVNQVIKENAKVWPGQKEYQRKMQELKIALDTFRRLNNILIKSKTLEEDLYKPFFEEFGYLISLIDRENLKRTFENKKLINPEEQNDKEEKERSPRIDSRRRNLAEGRGSIRTLNGRHLRRRPIIGGKDTWGKIDYSIDKRPGKPGYKEKYPENHSHYDYDTDSEPINIQTEKTSGRKYENYGEYQQYEEEEKKWEKYDKKFPNKQRPRPVSGKELRKEEEYYEEKNFGRDKILKRDGKVLKILR